MSVFTGRKYGTGFAIAASLFLTVPSFAQTTAAPPAKTPAPAQPVQAPAQPAQAPAQDSVSDSQTITIFAKKKPATRRALTQISSGSGKSCSFIGGNGDAEDFMDDYLSDMGYSQNGSSNDASGGTTDLGTGDTVDSSNPNSGTRQRVNGNAIFGDSAGNTQLTDGFAAVSTAPGGCTVADAATAAGRDFIASHDTTLKEAYAAYDAQDYAKALGLFEKAYNKVTGYEEAAVILGQMYFDGMGTPKDITKSLFWFKKAAEANPLPQKTKLVFDPASPNKMDARVEACMSLGQMYMRGIQVPRDPAEARKWFMRADLHGYIPAAHYVGRMYQSGYGGEKSMPKAISYFTRAGEAGYAPAQYQMGQLYYFGAEGLAVDKTRAGAWLLLAAKSGYPDALFAVGRMYDLGEGGATADLPKALVYYREAAVKGQVEAQTTLATYLYTGDGVPQDLDGARKLFDVAAKQGDAEAMFNLGVMWFNGQGGPKDRAIAFVWFRLAAETGLDKGDAAVTELGPKLTPEERAKAEAILNPKPAKK